MIRPASPDFRPDINGLRAIAVIAVLLFHLGVPGVAGGFAGVDVFFVISGYLIGGQLLDSLATGSFSFASFYIARLRRIYPALLPVCVAALVWGWHNSLPTDYIKAVRHAAGALFFCSNLLFSAELGYFDASAHTKPLLHTWSLAVEGQFYFLFPVALKVLHRWRPSKIVAATGLALTASLVYCLLSSHPDNDKLFYALLARAWELLAGAVLAGLRLNRPSPTRGNCLGILGLLLIAASFHWATPGDIWPGAEALIPIAGTVLVIAAQNPYWVNRLLNLAVVQYVGSISYSLYLWHWSLLVFYRRSAASLERPLQPFEIISLIAVSLLCAVASYHWIEKPTRWSGGFWTNKRIVTGAALGALASFGFGLFVVAEHGAPVRLPAYVQRASQAVFLKTPRDECFRQGDSSKVAKVAFCDFGAADAPTTSVLLWGDSHANQYLTAITTAANQRGLRGLIATQSACSARLRPIKTSNPRLQTCNQFNAEVLGLIRQSPELNTIILGKYWGPRDAASVAEMAELITALTALGKRVILIGALPSPGYDVPYEWSARQLQSGHAIDHVSLPRASQAQASAIQAALIDKLAALIRARLVVVLDPFSKLCNRELCYLVRNGESYYRDDSHLSEAIAQQFVPDFVAAFQQLLK